MSVIDDFERYLIEKERVAYQERQDYRASLAQANKESLADHEASWQDMQANAYRLSIVHMEDAQHQSQEFNLQSQEFWIDATRRTQSQVTQYAASGAMVAGSALARMDQTRSEGTEGARRLKARADIALQRGRLQARMTRMSPVEPEYTPHILPKELLDPDSPEATAARNKILDALRGALGTSTTGNKGCPPGYTLMTIQGVDYCVPKGTTTPGTPPEDQVGEGDPRDGGDVVTVVAPVDGGDGCGYYDPATGRWVQVNAPGCPGYVEPGGGDTGGDTGGDKGVAEVVPVLAPVGGGGGEGYFDSTTGRWVDMSQQTKPKVKARPPLENIGGGSTGEGYFDSDGKWVTAKQAAEKAADPPAVTKPIYQKPLEEDLDAIWLPDGWDGDKDRTTPVVENVLRPVAKPRLRPRSDDGESRRTSKEAVLGTGYVDSLTGKWLTPGAGATTTSTPTPVAESPMPEPVKVPKLQPPMGSAPPGFGYDLSYMDRQPSASTPVPAVKPLPSYEKPFDDDLDAILLDIGRSSRPKPKKPTKPKEKPVYQKPPEEDLDAIFRSKPTKPKPKAKPKPPSKAKPPAAPVETPRERTKRRAAERRAKRARDAAEKARRDREWKEKNAKSRRESAARKARKEAAANAKSRAEYERRSGTGTRNY